MTTIIGVDLGGTHLRAALCDASGKISHRIQQSVDAKRSPDEVIAQIVSLITSIEQESGTSANAVGLGVPGIVHAGEGIICQSPHYPEWQDFKLQAALSQQLKRPLFISNDANCHALAEAQFGAGTDVSDLIMLTLGTGIGGGIIIANELYTGEKGFAAELGHIVVEAEGFDCNCGSQGCLEMYASATGLKDTTGKDALELSESVRAGDEVARAVFEKMGYYLGVGIASMVNVLGIHTIVIGGGVSAAWDLFAESMQCEFERRSYQETAQLTQICRGRLGDDAGVIGAAYGAAKLLRSAS